MHIELKTPKYFCGDVVQAQLPHLKQGYWPAILILKYCIARNYRLRAVERMVITDSWGCSFSDTAHLMGEQRLLKPLGAIWGFGASIHHQWLWGLGRTLGCLTCIKRNCTCYLTSSGRGKGKVQGYLLWTYRFITGRVAFLLLPISGQDSWSLDKHDLVQCH